MIFKVSSITPDFISLSRVESQEKLGVKFTSNNQGFNFESSITSNPKISKHILHEKSYPYADQ